MKITKHKSPAGNIFRITLFDKEFIVPEFEAYAIIGTITTLGIILIALLAKR